MDQDQSVYVNVNSNTSLVLTPFLPIKILKHKQGNRFSHEINLQLFEAITFEFLNVKEIVVRKVNEYLLAKKEEKTFKKKSKEVQVTPKKYDIVYSQILTKEIACLFEYNLDSHEFEIKFKTWHRVHGEIFFSPSNFYLSQEEITFIYEKRNDIKSIIQPEVSSIHLMKAERQYWLLLRKEIDKKLGPPFHF